MSIHPPPPLTSFHSFRTPGGLLVEMRPIQPEDAGYLIDIFWHLSPQSIYQRFHQPLTNPDPAWLETTAAQLTRIKPPSAGWLAFADLPDQPHVPIGGGRFIVTAPGVAEAALTVRDDLQNQGIGGEILRLLIVEAHKVGVNKLMGFVQAGNQGILHLLRRMGLPYTQAIQQGEMVVEMNITNAPAEL